MNVLLRYFSAYSVADRNARKARVARRQTRLQAPASVEKDATQSVSLS